MLTVIDGGRDPHSKWPEIVVAERYAPPFAVGARVLPDDTYGVLAADTVVREPAAHPVRILTEAHDTPEAAGGSTTWEPTGAHQPWRVRVVVHDLARQPSWRRQWIADGLDAVFAGCRERGIDALALPLLGSVHGRLPRPEAVELICEALLRSQAPARLWIVVDRGWEEAVRTEFALVLDGA